MSFRSYLNFSRYMHYWTGTPMGNVHSHLHKHVNRDKIVKATCKVTEFPSKLYMRTAKTQISLRIRAAWSESSHSSPRIAKDPKCLLEDSENSDQAGWMLRLIWVFAWRTSRLVENDKAVPRLKYLVSFGKKLVYEWGRHKNSVWSVVITIPIFVAVVRNACI